MKEIKTENDFKLIEEEFIDFVLRKERDATNQIYCEAFIQGKRKYAELVEVDNRTKDLIQELKEMGVPVSTEKTEFSFNNLSLDIIDMGRINSISKQLNFEKLHYIGSTICGCSSYADLIEHIRIIKGHIPYNDGLIKIQQKILKDERKKTFFRLSKRRKKRDFIKQTKETIKNLREKNVEYDQEYKLLNGRANEKIKEFFDFKTKEILPAINAVNFKMLDPNSLVKAFTEIENSYSGKTLPQNDKLYKDYMKGKNIKDILIMRMQKIREFEALHPGTVAMIEKLDTKHKKDGTEPPLAVNILIKARSVISSSIHNSPPPPPPPKPPVSPKKQ